MYKLSLVAQSSCRGACPWWVRRPAVQESVLSELAFAGVMDAQKPAMSPAGGAGSLGGEDLHSLILSSLEEDGAFDVVSIALAGKSSEADAMVVASGRSTRHVASVAEKLIDRLKHKAGIVARHEGKDAADWVLIDAGDVIVHIFRPEVRDFYQLEKMWMTTPETTARTEN